MYIFGQAMNASMNKLFNQINPIRANTRGKNHKMLSVEFTMGRVNIEVKSVTSLSPYNEE